ncbi:hypothetical protein [Tellurirhabdus rosea]|nr:hypothetical protein [Tellurirhabdus rosea]
MKTLVSWLILLPAAILLFRTVRFDFLDLNHFDAEITWDDITDDLWA